MSPNVNPFYGSSVNYRPPVTMADGAHPMNSSQNAVVDDVAISRSAAVNLALALGVVFALHMLGFRFSMTVNA